MSDSMIDLNHVKNFGDLNRLMRRGYHPCNADRELFHDLVEHESDYMKLFQHIGYSLEKSAGESVDYYFLQQPSDSRASGDGTEDRSNTSFRMIVLVAALFDSGATNTSAGDSRLMDIFSGSATVDKSFFESVFDDTVAAERLKRFSVDRGDVQKIVKQMLMFNMLREEEDGKLRFLPPIRRVLDTVSRVADQVKGKKITEQNEGV